MQNSNETLVTKNYSIDTESRVTAGYMSYKYSRTPNGISGAEGLLLLSSAPLQFSFLIDRLGEFCKSLFISHVLSMIDQILIMCMFNYA